jgi:hypothetical protein
MIPCLKFLFPASPYVHYYLNTKCLYFRVQFGARIRAKLFYLYSTSAKILTSLAIICCTCSKCVQE